MNNKGNIQSFLFLFLGITLILSFACKKDINTIIPPTPPASNYTISINNLTNFPPKQFTYITLTPLETSDTELSYEFVCDPNITIDYSFYISKITFFKIRVYLYKNGPSIWWNSIALEPNKTSLIQLINGTGNYMDNTNFNSVKPDGCDIP
jgi:hypothetical protein